ncbi:hypothetical protein XELAEV_18008990mg [Xenopus laevis]|uniref:TBC1 domain family member 1 n=1 Tax=Xenopus laevis TaxID=8355 RepID=A0A974DT92_XENLA|nr:hypothetical protein XELAEV_18008990mg [Xenopus laevis]
MKARLQKLISIHLDTGQEKELKQVPEIIGSIRQAGKLARQEAVHSHLCDLDDSFSKKFEVLFCGRVIVANKKAPPALIDECIDKFNHVSCTKKKEGGTQTPQGDSPTLQPESAIGISFGNKLRSVFQSAFNDDDKNKPIQKSYSQPGLRTNISFTNEWKDGRSSLPTSFEDSDISLHVQRLSGEEQNGVQPTDMEENQTMLFTIGQAEVYLISPDTKRIVIEKSFKEISFCSQGIQHADHFGFICREPLLNGGCHFVCYVFQCTNGALVDEIMLTLKQAFSVAAVQQNSKSQPQLCDTCPMQCMQRLCERIEGLPSAKIKYELQKHLTTLTNQEQVSMFEEIQKIRPRSDQQENELVISRLRCLYEEKQRDHAHNAEMKQNSQAAESMANGLQTSASRFKLESLTSKAKRSLTESLENILSRGSRSRSLQESFVSGDDDGTSLDPSIKELSLCETEPATPLAIPLKSHGSLGDLSKSSDIYSCEHPEELVQQGFRRRANTLSHLPVVEQEFPKPVPITPSVPQRKLIRHHSVSTETPHKNDFECKSIHSIAGCESPVRRRRHSWRQQIFLRVATPQKGCDSPSRYDVAPGGCSGPKEKKNYPGRPINVNPRRPVKEESASLLPALPDHSDLGDIPPRSPLEPVREDYPVRSAAEIRHRTVKELRLLWKKAILQQILLLRMEKENKKLQASENDLQNKRLKLDYEEITPCLKDVTLVWEKMLGTPGRAKIKTDIEKIHAAVGQGVPRQHRGEIWKFLSEQYQLRHPHISKNQLKDTPYKELLKQLTTQQHAILIDLGRTFPTHPYFSAQLGAGQLSLYNILKAYSLLDPEVGYCQGLSFVAGVLLLHMTEEDAFKMLKFLMYDMGLRKQYRPDMITLQIQMYQLSRLLHDYHRDLYNHLETYEIGPSLYAAPWFLTMFASQFPLGFVARVFDMIFLQGSEVIFMVALSLLGSHKPLILQHENLESIVEFIKNTLPNLGLVQMEKTINQVFEMDISKQLQAYEVEYHVLQDELIDSSPLSDNQRINKLEKANSTLRKQNFDLLEELQVSHGRIQMLESTIENFQSNEVKLKQSTLELERSALLNTIEELRGQIKDMQENKLCTDQNEPGH